MSLEHPRRGAAEGKGSGSPLGDGLHDLVHRDGETLSRQGGDCLVGDAAGDDVVEHRQIRVDIEGEAVHRPAPVHPHADGAYLAGAATALGAEPYTRVPIEPLSPLQAEVTEHVDDELLDPMDKGRHGSRPDGHVQHRVADELAGPVIGDVTAAVCLADLRPRLVDARQQVITAGSHSEGVHGGVLEEEQVVAGPGVPYHVLKIGCLLVADTSEPPHPERGRAIEGGCHRSVMAPDRPPSQLRRPIPRLDPRGPGRG